MKEHVILYKSFLRLKDLGCDIRSKLAYDNNLNIVSYTFGDDWNWNNSFIGYVSILSPKVVQDWLIEHFKLVKCTFNRTGSLKTFEYDSKEYNFYDESDFVLNSIIEFFHLNKYWNKLENNTSNLTYPESKEWMFDYCKCLGSFNDGDIIVDLGIFFDGNKLLDATVYDNEPGSYSSGTISQYNDNDRPHIDEIKRILTEKGFIL